MHPKPASMPLFFFFPPLGKMVNFCALLPPSLNSEFCFDPAFFSYEAGGVTLGCCWTACPEAARSLL